MGCQHVQVIPILNFVISYFRELPVSKAKSSLAPHKNVTLPKFIFGPLCSWTPLCLSQNSLKLSFELYPMTSLINKTLVKCLLVKLKHPDLPEMVLFLQVNLGKGMVRMKVLMEKTISNLVYNLALPISTKMTTVTFSCPQLDSFSYNE